MFKPREGPWEWPTGKNFLPLWHMSPSVAGILWRWEYNFKCVVAYNAWKATVMSQAFRGWVQCVLPIGIVQSGLATGTSTAVLIVIGSPHPLGLAAQPYWSCQSQVYRVSCLKAQHQLEAHVWLRCQRWLASDRLGDGQMSGIVTVMKMGGLPIR